ncbi:MAG: YbjQ family protein [Pseudomonadota bacterium]
MRHFVDRKRRTVQLSNLETIPGKRVVKHYGLVQGRAVRAKHVGRDFVAAFRHLFGGELDAYTGLLHEAREEALEQMQESAHQVGANAVLNVRFSTSSVMHGAAEVFVYGTAVFVE